MLKQEIDLKSFIEELEQLRSSEEFRATQEDLNHFEKFERWGKICSSLGYSTALACPNIFSALLIGQGKFARWISAHHTLHQAFNSIPEAKRKHRSGQFAKKWRRYSDWFDWLTPESWDYEHNVLHHYNLGEEKDPDFIQLNFKIVRDAKVPIAMKYVLLVLLASTWKWTYYAPTASKQWYVKKKGKNFKKEDMRLKTFDEVFLPFSSSGKYLWTQCYLPYFIFNFALVPAFASVLSPWCGFSMLCNQMMAEVFTNIQAFLVIWPNHTGEDLYNFSDKVKKEEEFILRQIIGSANYKTGNDFFDFLQGYLNYQIEHHIWPDLTPLQYKKIQPKVKEICARYGIPYVQENLASRVLKMIDITTGRKTMRTAKTEKTSEEANTYEFRTA